MNLCASYKSIRRVFVPPAPHQWRDADGREREEEEERGKGGGGGISRIPRDEDAPLPGKDDVMWT